MDRISLGYRKRERERKGSRTPSNARVQDVSTSGVNSIPLVGNSLYGLSKDGRRRSSLGRLRRPHKKGRHVPYEEGFGERPLIVPPEVFAPRFGCVFYGPVTRNFKVKGVPLDTLLW